MNVGPGQPTTPAEEVDVQGHLHRQAHLADVELLLALEQVDQVRRVVGGGAERDEHEVDVGRHVPKYKDTG